MIYHLLKPGTFKIFLLSATLLLLTVADASDHVILALWLNHRDLEQI